MPKAASCGLPHSESEVYYGKSSTIGLTPTATCCRPSRAAIRRYFYPRTGAVQL